MANYPARSSGDQTVNYLRQPITSATGIASTIQLGTLPAGCAVLRVSTVVTTAFNSSTTNVLKVGTVASDAAICSSCSIAALGSNIGTMGAVGASFIPTVDTPLIATNNSTGSAPSAGTAVVVVEYCPVL